MFDRNMTAKWLLLSVASLALVVSCGEDELTAPKGPMIESITPSSGEIGRSVDITITGTNLSGASLTSSDTALTVSGVVATETQITATLNLSDQATEGNITITVTTDDGTDTISFSLALPGAPVISSISPAEGEIGDDVAVQIQGRIF